MTFNYLSRDGEYSLGQYPVQKQEVMSHTSQTRNTRTCAKATAPNRALISVSREEYCTADSTKGHVDILVRLK